MEVLDKIASSVGNMDKEGVKKYVSIALNEEKLDIKDIYENGLNKGMTRVLELYDEKKYFLPEVVVCSDALNEGISLLRGIGEINLDDKTKITMAVVKGDTHEIGKNIVKIMMEASGFNVVDIGVNKDSESIVSEALENNSDIIALSSMMTSTMTNMEGVIKTLDEKIKGSEVKRPKVIVGGAPVSDRFAKKIGADGYSDNAPEAVKLVKNLMEEK